VCVRTPEHVESRFPDESLGASEVEPPKEGDALRKWRKLDGRVLEFWEAPIMYTNLLTKGRHHPTSQLLFQVLQDNAMFLQEKCFQTFFLVFYVKLVEFVQFSMVRVTNIILSD